MTITEVTEWWDRHGKIDKMDKINEIIQALNALEGGGFLVWNGLIDVKPSNETGKLYFTLPEANMTVKLKVWGQYYRTPANADFLKSHTHSYKVGDSAYDGFEGHWSGVGTHSGHIYAASAGSGLTTTNTPKTVNYHINGGGANNLWTNQTIEYSSGEIDISSLVTTAGEHYIQLKETGGVGGRLQYEIIAS